MRSLLEPLVFVNIIHRNTIFLVSLSSTHTRSFLLSVIAVSFASFRNKNTARRRRLPATTINNRVPKRAVESRRKPRSISNYYRRRRRTSGGRQHVFLHRPRIPIHRTPEFGFPRHRFGHAGRNNNYHCCTQTQSISLLFSADGTLETRAVVSSIYIIIYTSGPYV